MSEAPRNAREAIDNLWANLNALTAFGEVGATTIRLPVRTFEHIRSDLIASMRHEMTEQELSRLECGPDRAAIKFSYRGIEFVLEY